MLFKGVGARLGAVHGNEERKGVMLAWNSRPKRRETSGTLDHKYAPPSKGVAELVSGKKVPVLH